MPRFDLASVSQIQSRDGGVTKGGLMRNGFVEKDRDGETWCWQRPALVSTLAAPFGTIGQGLYVSATSLWGVYNDGTARGVSINTATTAYTLVAGTVDGGNYGALISQGIGSVTPSTWAGFAVDALYVGVATMGADAGIWFSVSGVTTQGRFKSLTLNGQTVQASAAAFSNPSGTGSLWRWSNIPLTTGGTYAGNFAALSTKVVNYPGISSLELIDIAGPINGTGILKGTGTAYAVFGTNVAAISDADFPTLTVRGIQFLDGTYYVMDPDGVIYNSIAAGNDPTDWPTDGFITSEFEPDGGVCLGKALNYIVAFGRWSTQLFWDAANPTGSPLLPVNNGVLLIGCASADSVAQTESTLVWMAQRKAQDSSSHFGRFIAILVGTNYEELSTPDVNRVLDADDLASVKSVIIEMGGHSWYLLGLGTSGITLAYDMKNKLWYVWTRLAAGSAKTISAISQTNGLVTGTSAAHGFSDGDPVVISGVTPSTYNGTLNVNVTGTSAFTYPTTMTGTGTGTGASMQATPYVESAMMFSASLGFDGKQVAQDLAGNVYSLSLGTALDDGSIPINWRIRTISMDDGNTNRKFAGQVSVVGDLAGTATGMVRFTDNDYQSYGYFRRFDMSKVQNHENRWGHYVRRAWEWRYTDRERLRVKALEVDIKKGVT